MAEMIEEIIGYQGGREKRLADLGGFFLGVGIIGMVVAFVLAYRASNGLRAIWIVAGAASLIEGVALHAILQGRAEVIRLLKKLNGMNFGGEITEAQPVFSYRCSKCSLELDGTEDYCPECRSEFEEDEEAQVDSQEVDG